MNIRKQIRSKVKSIFKESLSYNDADTKQPSDPYLEDKLVGGVADNKTISDIAAKHAGNTAGRLYTTMFYLIKSQIEDGIKDEMEHTKDPKVALEIVKDHLMENPQYYLDLKKAGIEENQLNEMPYVHDLNGKSLDLQMEKWITEEEFKKFLMNLFVGETISDPKQPELQVSNPEELIKKLTDFNNDINNPATQLLIQFTRKFRNPKANLKTITKDDVEYLKSFIIDAYNLSKERFT